jgi:hypothetical protein
MHRRFQKTVLLLALTVLSSFILLAGAPAPAAASMPVAIRPIADFTSTQGTTNLFIPPVPDFIAWANNNPQTLFASVDYAGLANSWLVANGGPNLGTQVSGTVTDRPQKDGRSIVTVVLHTTNANTWVVPLPGDVAADPLVFGYRAQDLAANPSLTPALSESHLQAEFMNTGVGAPLPDLVNAFILGNALPGQELRMLSFRSSGSGPLRAAFGVPDGTPGTLAVTQTGLFQAGFHGAVGDAFPAEKVILKANGQ